MQINSITHLSSRVIRILGCNPGPFTLQGTNTYLIGKGFSRTLLDVGEPKNDQYLSLLKSVLDSNKLSIKNIIITHWHPDHIGGLQDFIHYFKPKDCKYYKLKCPEHDPDEITFNYLSDDQEFFVDENCTLKIYHTPGHTKDHISIVLKEENALFSGDCILGHGTSVFEDLFSYMKTLEKLLSLKAEIIYPGHGFEVYNPEKKIKEYIDHRNKREKMIFDCLSPEKSKAITVDSILQIVYKDVPKNMHFAAASNINNHLEKLQKDGKIRFFDNSNHKRFYWAC